MLPVMWTVGAGATPTLPTNKEQAGAMCGSAVCISPWWTNWQAQVWLTASAMWLWDSVCWSGVIHWCARQWQLCCAPCKHLRCTPQSSIRVCYLHLAISIQLWKINFFKFSCGWFYLYRCGYDQHVGSSSDVAPTDGVLGLGSGSISLLSQLSQHGITKNVVGHCLSLRGGGFLFFGDDLVPYSRATWTPMARSAFRWALSSLYFILDSSEREWGFSFATFPVYKSKHLFLCLTSDVKHQWLIISNMGRILASFKIVQLSYLSC